MPPKKKNDAIIKVEDGKKIFFNPIVRKGIVYLFLTINLLTLFIHPFDDN